MLKKLHRLRKWEVERVLKKGADKKIGDFIVKYIENKKGFYSWNTVLSVKFAKKAVDRNKKRRQVYEAIRLAMNDHEEKGYDIALIPMKKVLNSKYITIAQHINDILTFFES